MSPSEYQELAEFVAASLERQARDFREQLVAQTDEILRFVDIRLEAVRSEIQVVAEGVAANRERSRTMAAGSRTMPAGSTPLPSASMEWSVGSTTTRSG